MLCRYSVASPANRYEPRLGIIFLRAHTSKMKQRSATGKAFDAERDRSVADDWSFFERIYCISIEDRVDRRRAAQAQFHSVGLGDRVEFHLVRKHPNNCEQGIYESHLHCLASGLTAGAERILIFEDDVVFSGFSPERLADAIRFLRLESDWQAFFLGCLVHRSRKTVCRSVVHVRYRSLAHAYAVSRNFAETLVANYPWRGLAYDALLRDLCSSHFYALYPAIAFQSNSPSDNDPYLPLDRFRRLCGGLQAVQRSNEWYQRHKGVIICFHALVVLMGALLLLSRWPRA